MSKPYQPSNGSEGEGFQEAFCNHCERDRAFRETDYEGDPALGCQFWRTRWPIPLMIRNIRRSGSQTGRKARAARRSRPIQRCRCAARARQTCSEGPSREHHISVDGSIQRPGNDSGRNDLHRLLLAPDADKVRREGPGRRDQAAVGSARRARRPPRSSSLNDLQPTWIAKSPRLRGI